MTVHELKTWPRFFDALLDGRKTAEVRKNDRAFAEGDDLHLREWDPTAKSYTGREITMRVTYITDLPCLPGMVLMSVAAPACPNCGAHCQADCGWDRRHQGGA